jgi:class 3 adenylate cyclase/tetratricopeptide (TPR) repeat protein
MEGAKMQCPKCQFENPDDAQFCIECGNPIEFHCPQCEAITPATGIFCKACGHKLAIPSEPVPKKLSIDEKLEKIQKYLPKGLTEKILSQKDRIEGERKQVTVMFCDMEGFTHLSESLGSEEAYNIMDQVYEILIHKVHDYEGTVNEMTGDGIMALFGAPIALEDASQRAIRSAMAIHREMVKFSHRLKQEKEYTDSLYMRIGIHTGPVVVGTLGNDLRVEFKAVGDTVNLASRMEGLAEPGTTYVTYEIFKLTEGIFRFEALGKMEVKGKKDLAKVYRVIAPSTRRTRFDVSAERGLSTFVGREREIEILLDAFERAKDGRGQAISIMSEAGAGKSRLLYEFRKAVANENVTFLEGKCLSYCRGVVYHPVIDILRSNFDVQESHGDSEIRDKVKRGLQALHVDEGSTLPYLLELLSVKDCGVDEIPMNPEARKDRITEALKRIVLKGSQIRPLIMAFEDLHWVDESSEAVTKYLLESIAGARVLLIFTYRPEFVHTWSAKSFHSHITLNRLSNRESLAMVSQLLGTENMDQALEKLILDKTEGIPFFIEEFVKSLTELKIIEKQENRYYLVKDIKDIIIPSTVQDVIMARIDSLPEGTKGVLQTGSVAGREFSQDLMEKVTDISERELLSHLSVLKDSELLYERGIYPHSTYIFKHALTQEVAYDSLLKQKQREIHASIAAAMEELYAERLEQHYELLAHHWGLSDSPDRSIHYLVLAGEKSNRSQAATTAVDFFTRSLNQIEKLDKAPDPTVMMRIRSGRAVPLHSKGRIEESLEDYKEAIRLAHASGDQHMVLRCLTEIPFLIYNTTFKDKVPQFCEQGLEVARDLEDKGAEARIMTVYAYWRYLWKGTKELATLQRSVGLAEKSGQPLAQIRARSILALLERWNGNSEQSLEHLEGVLETSGPVLSIVDVTLLSFIRGMALTDTGKYTEAIELLSQWIDVLVQNEVYINLGRCYNILGWTHAELYDFEKAFRYYKKALENAINLRKSPAILYSALEMRSMSEVSLMENKFDIGKIDAAWEHMILFEKESAHTDFDYIRERWEIRMNDLKGKILMKRGDLEGAENQARLCLKTAMKRDYKKYIGKAERLNGEILLAKGAYDQAEGKFKKAVAKLEEVGNPKQLWMTYVALAQLYEKMKRSDLEREQWQKAAQIVTLTADELQDSNLKETFASAAPVRQILENVQR